ncbi:hypothetical protein AZI86_17395 [Bdellovibrio bacteriovorus]|uniref:Lipoprotein n=1 Tax=Bdellovibrio bacteriovorus TaxID=959 RepID=A0A150WEG5_BDEBC|nr:hypothetical protein [Bdellovibrio bacteriovorus]KYG61487.1 hypothetical protein AZI86_17395 [Bdellovibrio bacteriovorus]
MLKYLVTALVAMSFVGCSFDKGGGDNIKAQKAKDDAETKAIFDPLVGNYEGQMRFNGTLYDVELAIGYVTQTESGKTDEKGQPITRIVPRATLKRNNPVGVDVTFDVIYDPAAPQLELINVESTKSANGGGAAPATLGPNDIHSIFFDQKGISLAAKTFVGSIKNDGPTPRGTISLRPSSTEQSAPDENPDQAYYNRLRKVYEPLVGKYVGNSVLDGKSQEYSLTINMRIDTSQDLEIPVLYGLFVRTDDPTQNSALNLGFTYRTNTQQFRIDGTPRNFGNTSYKATITGKIVKNAFTGSWTSTRGFEGNLLLKKVGPNGEVINEPVQDEEKCFEPAAAKWPTLPEKGPIPTPRPKCP